MMFLILLAGLIGVLQDQIKAARLLGASWGQILTRISLPRIRAVIVIAIGIRFIEALKLFDVMFIMTKGGPGVATETYDVPQLKAGTYKFECSIHPTLMNGELVAGP